MPIRALVLVMLSLAATACDEEEVCSAGALADALAAATPGTTVAVGACTIEGAFVVPAGVSVRGRGASSVLRSDASGEPVLAVEGAAGASSTIASLALVSASGGLAVRAAGGGALELDALDVAVERGIGIGVRQGSVTMRASTIHGPITSESAASAPTDPSSTGAWGVVAEDATVTLHDVRLTGLATGAIAIVGGSLAWTDDDELADVDASRGVGVALYGAVGDLEGVELGGMLSGIGLPGLALAAIDGDDGPSDVTLADTTIRGGAGYGVFADGATVHLARVSVEDVGLVGVQLQGGALDAAELTLRGAGGAGLALIDARSASLERSTIAMQRRVALPVDLGTAPMADGLQIRRTGASAPPIDVDLQSVTLEGNPRVGLLLDSAESAPARLAIADVTVSAGDAGALGVVAQRATLPDGWDDGVTRDAVTVANDAAFPGGIDVVGLVMPPALAPPPL